MLDRHPEYQYLDLLKRVLDEGDKRIDRTAIGTLSVFGAMARFDVNQCAPILTTKRVYWKTAIKEMLWFLTGETNMQPLPKENVRIWTDWPLACYRKESGDFVSQPDFERRIVEDDEFAARWGDLGPAYGKQWRRWLGLMAVIMIRSRASSIPCATIRQAAAYCSMAGTSQKSIKWLCRHATWFINSMSPKAVYRVCCSSGASMCCSGILGFPA